MNDNTITVSFITDKGPVISKQLDEQLQHKSYYTPLKDPETQKFVTGLSEEELEFVRKSLKMTKEEIEPTFAKDEEHPFWESSRVRTIMKSTTLFNLSRPLDLVKYKYLVARKIIAPSLEDLERPEYQHSIYVVIDSSELDEMRASKVNQKKAAYIKLGKLSPERIKQIASILEEESMTAQSENYCLVKIDEVIDKKPARFNKIAAMSADEITARSVLIEAFVRSIITEKPYTYKGKLLGNTLEEAAKFLNMETNSSLYNEIKGKIV